MVNTQARPPEMVEWIHFRYDALSRYGQEDGVEPRKSLRERNAESALPFAGLKPDNSEGLASPEEVVRRIGEGASDWPLLLAARVRVDAAKAWDDSATLDAIKAEQPPRRLRSR